MLEIQDGKFYLDGKKFNIYSGVIHYFRVLPQYWEDRLRKLRAAGLNTVETYVAWNLHEPREGEFCFEGLTDICRFVDIAAELGLYVIVRPGPYICAEWDFGGFPAWLLKDKNIRLRCNDEKYLGYVRAFYKELLGRLADRQITRGGNIIAMQVENEYGSYANDKKYLAAIRDIMVENGVEVLLFTSDGDWCNMISGGSLPEIYKTINFGSRAATAFNSLKGIQDDAPKTCMEFWDGWFDHWGEKHHTRPAAQIVKEVNDFLAQDANFNFYMFCGGTNFNFWAGANHHGKYQPTVTSYDYSAPLTEWGDYTPAYHAIRDVLLRKQDILPQELPPRPVLQTIGKVTLTQSATLRDHFAALAEKHYSPMPESMEFYGQNFGMIHYHTEIRGKYTLAPLIVRGVRDRAYVYVNGKFRTILNRNAKRSLFSKKNADEQTVGLLSVNGSATVDILVEAMGRVNYGEFIYDRKGIDAVRLGKQILCDWDVYTLPMDDLSKVAFAEGMPAEKPAFLRGVFRTDSTGDCFVHMDKFRKGFVCVNGFNLGRYWEIGPQKALYLPGCLLRAEEENEIVVFEQDGFAEASVVIDDRPDLG